MPQFSLVILYVDDPTASAAFYTDLLGQPPVQASPTFAMFCCALGVGIGLWSRHTVTPSAATGGGGGEVAFAVGDIDAIHSDWVARGLVVAQAPTELDFGRTFVALDPDGHRLRVFAPATSRAPATAPTA